MADANRAREVAEAIALQYGLEGRERQIATMLETEFSQVRWEERRAERARCLAVATFWNVRHSALRRDIQNGFEP